MSDSAPKPTRKEPELDALTGLTLSTEDVEAWFDSPVWVVFKQAILATIVKNRSIYENPGCPTDAMRTMIAHNAAYRLVLSLEEKIVSEVLFDSSASNRTPTPDEIVRQVSDLLQIQLGKEI